MAKIKEVVLTAQQNPWLHSCPLKGKAHVLLTLQHHHWETNRA